MTNPPPPEAIRGCWFFIPDASPQAQSGQKISSLLQFNLDGSFTRFQIKDNTRKDIEQGTYTFDGKFLILRGRITDTFRVSYSSFFHWNLEGKKDGQALVRGFIKPDNLPELSPTEQKEIRLLSLRVAINDEQTHPLSAELTESKDGISNGIFQLTYQNTEQQSVHIANFFVEYHPNNRLWIGLTPFTPDIDPELWQRIICDCFLDNYLKKPDDIAVVTIRLLDTDHSQTFNYQTPH